MDLLFSCFIHPDGIHFFGGTTPESLLASALNAFSELPATFATAIPATAQTPETTNDPAASTSTTIANGVPNPPVPANIASPPVKDIPE